MLYKSFDNLLFELREASSKEEKAKAFHSYIYEKKDYIEFIDTNSYQKRNKTYYISDIVNKFHKIDSDDWQAISEIYAMILNKRKLSFNFLMKKNLVEVFNITRASDVKDILLFYPFIRDKIRVSMKYEKVSCEDIDISLSNYLSLVVSKERREEGIVIISDLKDVVLNSVEIINIRSYCNDLKKYIVNDKLVLSIIDGLYRDAVLAYSRLGTFKQAAIELRVSTTKVRVAYYTAVKRIVDFFYSARGVRALLLMFSHFDGYITGKKLEELFPTFHEVIKMIFKNNYLYDITYDKDNDRYGRSEEKSVIRLVGFDLDDTLLNSKKEIQDIDAVKELVSNGIKICFCSGRPYVNTIKEYYKQVGLTRDIYYVAFNGVAVYRVDDDKLIYGNSLNERDIKTITSVVNREISANFNEDDFAMYCYKMDNTVESTRINEYVLLEEKFNKTKIKVGDFSIDTKQAHKIMISGKPELVNKLFDCISKDLTNDFEVLISMPFFIEVYKKNNDKYQSLLKVADEYGISSDEIMTFGDSLNDLTLVKNGKIGIAMGNSVPKVKEVASYVASDNDHYGVTEALVRYGLIKKSNH